MANILVCDDDKDIVGAIEIYLKEDGHVVYSAYNGKDALSVLEKEDIQLVILDIMMPGLDGFELCKIIRKRSDIPVVFLTGKVREEDVLYGYELGADDYIVKPFSIAILYSKLMALLERTTAVHEERKIITSGEIALDPLKLEVTVSGSTIDLPPKEYQILKYMMEHPGVAVTRRLLLAVAWGGDDFISERVIDNRVKNLRKKLKKEGSRIRTLIGVGYRFD